MITASPQHQNTDDRRRLVIAVDLTPLLPGAENGGAKLIALDLTRRLAERRKDWDLVLLTSPHNHEELAPLEAENVRRSRIEAGPSPNDHVLWNSIRLAAQKADLLAVRLPLPLRRTAREVLLAAQQVVANRRQPTGVLEEIGADALLCPFTAVLFYSPDIPVVSILYDLQHLYYPQFFSPLDLAERTRNAEEACRLASRIVCISDYVRSTVVERLAIDPSHIATVHPAHAHELPAESPQVKRALLAELVLEEEQFLLYPANFWAHKNHRILLTALGIHLSRHPSSNLKLVLTGSPGPAMEQLMEARDAMGLGTSVVFAGFLAEEKFAALLRSCFALVFPSLYEGFGMPVLEAMEAGKPILCSNVTSLPEVAGDAALRFDPRRPVEIADAIHRLEEDHTLRGTLVQAGSRRLRAFQGPEETAARYEMLLDEVLKGDKVLRDGVHGLYADGWTSERVRVAWSPGTRRTLEVTLRAPSWLPKCVVRSGSSRKRHRLSCGKTETLRFPLDQSGGVLDLFVAPATRPCTYGVGDDTRLLGCQCLSLRIVGGPGPVDLLRRSSSSE